MNRKRVKADASKRKSRTAPIAALNSAKRDSGSIREELRGIKRVLKLLDGYLSTQPQDLCLAWGGGLMTYGELRWHIEAALKTKVLS